MPGSVAARRKGTGPPSQRLGSGCVRRVPQVAEPAWETGCPEPTERGAWSQMREPGARVPAQAQGGQRAPGKPQRHVPTVTGPASGPSP